MGENTTTDRLKGWEKRKTAKGYDAEYRRSLDIERGTFHSRLLVPAAGTKNKVTLATQYEWPVGHFLDEVAFQYDTVEAALNANDELREKIWR